MDVVGSFDTVAAQMGEAMETAGGDGFLFDEPVTRHDIITITDGCSATTSSPSDT